jgi:hypothetical protein
VPATLHVPDTFCEPVAATIWYATVERSVVARVLKSIKLDLRARSGCSNR